MKILIYTSINTRWVKATECCNPISICVRDAVMRAHQCAFSNGPLQASAVNLQKKWHGLKASLNADVYLPTYINRLHHCPSGGAINLISNDKNSFCALFGKDICRSDNSI